MVTWRIKPKSIEELDSALRGESGSPRELIEFRYREKFHLSYQELMEEPIHIFYMNLKIMELESQIIQEESQRTTRKARNNGSQL
jgi:hypothetical protein